MSTRAEMASNAVEKVDLRSFSSVRITEDPEWVPEAPAISSSEDIGYIVQ